MLKGNGVIERQVLVDLGAPDHFDPLGDQARPEYNLVHPAEALQWLATGKFYSEPPGPAVQPWIRFTFSYDEGLWEREVGRLELAEELLGHAVKTGRARVAIIDHLGAPFGGRNEPSPRLSVLSSLEQMQNIALSSDDGLGLYITLPRSTDAPEQSDDAGWDDDDDYVVFEDFYFIWEDVAQLRPERPTEATTTAHTAWESTPVAASTSTPHARGILPQSQLQADRRGRKPRHYGGPIAAFLARAVREGLERVSKEKDEALGRRLIEEFKKRGDPNPPNLRNASSDARGALVAWIAAADLPD